MLARLLLLVAVVLAVHAFMTISARIRPRRRVIVPAGLTLVVSAGCHACDRAKAALDALGHRYRTLDAAQAEHLGVRSHTVPYAVVGDRSGRVAMVRRGPAVLGDVDALVAASNSG